jgi:hypothetical protein
MADDSDPNVPSWVNDGVSEMSESEVPRDTPRPSGSTTSAVKFNPSAMRRGIKNPNSFVQKSSSPFGLGKAVTGAIEFPAELYNLQLVKENGGGIRVLSINKQKNVTSTSSTSEYNDPESGFIQDNTGVNLKDNMKTIMAKLDGMQENLRDGGISEQTKQYAVLDSETKNVKRISAVAGGGKGVSKRRIRKNRKSKRAHKK